MERIYVYRLATTGVRIAQGRINPMIFLVHIAVQIRMTRHANP